MLCAFNRSSFNFHPINAGIHLFIDQTTHQHQVSSNDEDSHGLEFVLRIALCCLNSALLGGCEDEIGLIVDGSENTLIGSAVNGDDADDIYRITT